MATLAILNPFTPVLHTLKPIQPQKKLTIKELFNFFTQKDM